LTYVLDIPDDIPKERWLETFNSYWNRYRGYLASLEGTLPASAYAFATADWHYDPQDHRCPHDAWVEELVIRELSSGEDRQIRGLEIFVRLLGAHHDGYIELTYQNVNIYRLSYAPSPVRGAHSDWIVDEVRLSESNKVIHEIAFASDARWYIECEDIVYEWLPFDHESMGV